MADEIKGPRPTEMPVPQGEENFDLIVLAHKMHTTIDSVKEAIKIVGNNRGYVEAYLLR